jgi:flagellar hook-associated protein 2
MGISLNPFSLLSGEGLDVTSLVNQILTQKSGQLSQWGSEQSLLRVQAGLLTTINSDLSRLADAVTALSDPIGALTAQAATSSNPALLTATADSSAAPGIHSITINSLASSGLVYTDSVAGGANVSILPSEATTGQLTVQIGGSSGTTAAIQITAGSNDTLTTLAASINQQSAANNWGIRAAVVNDVTGSRLSITSQTTGTPGALTISSHTTTLSFNPPGGGTNASLTIDGIPYLSTSNSIPGAIAGVTLNLSGAAPNSPIQLTVGPDATQISASITEFVNAYNQVISDINSQFKVDPTTNTEGPLGGDSALRSLQNILLKSVTFSVPDNSGLVNLASLGINMNNDGTLTVGATPAGQSMSQVLAGNAQAFRNFFQNASSTGFANAFHADLLNLTDSMDGLLNVDLAQNKTQQNNLADSIAKFQDQLAAQQKALTNQFALVNASLQTYPMLLQQITQTLSALDTSSNKTNGS